MLMHRHEFKRFGVEITDKSAKSCSLLLAGQECNALSEPPVCDVSLTSTSSGGNLFIFYHTEEHTFCMQSLHNDYFNREFFFTDLHSLLYR